MTVAVVAVAVVDDDERRLRTSRCAMAYPGVEQPGGACERRFPS